MNGDGDAERDVRGEEDPGARGRGSVDPGPDAGSDADVTFAVLGDPDGGPALSLDHERFAYAGKFVMSGTGKAVVRRHGSGADGEHGEVLAAAAFDRDRTDRSVVRIRYVTVRRDRRGEALGARLLASLAERLLSGSRAADERAADEREVAARASDAPVATDVREVRIAVNNPFAYEAASKAGFGYTGERTGIAELLCARPGDRSAETYRDGLSTFLARDDLDEAERTFVEERLDAGPPATVSPLAGS